jgi:hypothetical protein
MLVVSESYKNDQYGAVSKQLTNVRKGGKFVGGGRGGALYSYHTRASTYIRKPYTPQKWEIQIRRILHFSLILSGPLPFLARLSTFPLRPF